MRQTALLLLVLFTFFGCKRETVATAQDERSANRILNLLARSASIEAEKVYVERSNPPSFDVSVPAPELQRALSVLDEQNLPAEHIPDTCSLLANGALIPTEEQQQAKRICGISGDISNKLRRIDGIVEASAAVAIPEREPLAEANEPTPRPKISVFVAYLASLDGQPPISVDDVARFAASSVAGAEMKDVFVRMVEAPKTYSTAALGTCVKSSLFGLLICGEDRARIATAFLTAAVVSALLAALTVIATLRALRYRRELTRLTRASVSPGSPSNMRS